MPEVVNPASHSLEGEIAENWSGYEFLPFDTIEEIGRTCWDFQLAEYPFRPADRATPDAVIALPQTLQKNSVL